MLICRWRPVWRPEDELQEPLELLLVVERDEGVGELKGISRALSEVVAVVAEVAGFLLVFVAAEQRIDLRVGASELIAEIGTSVFFSDGDPDQIEPAAVDPPQRSHLVWMLQRSEHVSRLEHSAAVLAPRPDLGRGGEREELSLLDGVAEEIAGVHHLVKAFRAVGPQRFVGAWLDAELSGELTQAHRAHGVPELLEAPAQEILELVEVRSYRCDDPENELRVLEHGVRSRDRRPARHFQKHRAGVPAGAQVR